MTQIGRHGIADVVGGAGTGEDDAHAAELLEVGEEGLDGLLVLLVDIERIAPQVGLLLDLCGGDVGSEGLEFL